MNSIRVGMQVHAVPEAERAYDSSGRQLPWGYDYADNERRVPEEKGPFGKSTRRRGVSRTKSATPGPRREEDRNATAFDELFSSYTKGQDAKQKPTERIASAPPAPLAGPNQLLDGNASTANIPTSQAAVAKEPTEVILYGFGSDVQWAAIDWYEKVSGGLIYEDYERHPPHVRYNHLSLNTKRALAQRSLSQAALRKKNTFIGGDHWIKVTFDSPEAADNACHYSPHTIQGYLVYAERYRGVGPKMDSSIPASLGASQQSQNDYSPVPASSATLWGTSISSATASSATATASTHHPSELAQSNAIPDPIIPGAMTQAVIATGTEIQRPTRRPMRIPGARRAELLPAEQALMPAGSRWQKTFGEMPIIGWFVGGGEIIGSHVPRRDDGSFDWERASFYWKLCYIIDAWLGWLGVDLCGIKDDD